ncbi:MAG TPA: tetratricopeptide repeat protein [Gemmatimonadaceae bacterium]|nr:tetratricopeptide repeat protein [Gemmatimonadaceae bacterium]
MAASGRVDELKKRYDENPRRFFAPLANEYRKSGDLELAIDLCRQHLAESPQNLSGQIVFGQALFDAGSLEEAESAFGTAISLDPENLIALRHLGDIARAQNDAVRARLWYQRVIDADPRNDEVAAILAELPAEARASDAVVVQEAAAPLEVEPTSLTETVPSPPAADPIVAEPPAEPPPSMRPTPAISARTVPPPQPISQADVKTVEIPALPPRPRADAEAISFADEAPAAEASATEERAVEPASPPPAVGFDVDFGAAAGLGMPDEPMMGAVGESSAFGSVDVPTESPFGTAEDFTPESPFGTSGRGKSATPGYTAPTPSEVEEAAPPPLPVIEAEAPPPPPPPPRPATPPRAASPIAPVRAVTPVPAPASLEFDVVDAAPPVRPREVPARHPAAAGVEEFELEPAENEAESKPAESASEPESFATETMAELYVKQGLSQKAIDVYRELIRARPNDDGLKARLAELEGDGRGAKRLTARTFFSAIATRRATPARPQTPPRDSAVVDDVPVPVEELDEVDAPPRASSSLPFIDTSEPEPAAPAEVAAEAAAVDEPEPATVDADADEVAARPARPTIDALFGNADVAAMDDTAAHSLAAAFGGARANVGGRPARAASDEVSLDEVFRRAGRETPSGGLAVPRQSATLRFDQFFAGGSAEQSSSQPDSGPDPSGDSEQFQAWLNGLKKQ